MSRQIREELLEPFHPSEIHWRVGSTNAKQLGCKPWEATKGMPLAYLDARNVQDRLDDVFGIDGWSSDFKEVSGRLMCTITAMGVSKSDAGSDSKTEAEKGGASDALKRAAVNWGIGRYLYSLGSSWLDLNEGKLVFKTYKTNGIQYKAPFELPVSAIPMPDPVKKKLLPLKEALDIEDKDQFAEYWTDLNQEQQTFLWTYFRNKEQTIIRSWGV